MTDLTVYVTELRRLHRETMKQGREFEEKAEKYRLDAEATYGDVAAMKAEGRVKVRVGRILPDSTATADYRTNQYKVVADAKGDVVLWLSWSASYAALAQVKYAKAAAIMAEILTWRG